MFGLFKKSVAVDEFPLDNTREQKEFSINTKDFKNFLPDNSIYGVVFDGEITPNELGIPKHFIPDYQRLAARSWQAYIESDVIFTLVNRLAEWVIGRGINLVSVPKEKLLRALGADFEPKDLQTFSQLFESLFDTIKSNKRSTKDMRFSLDQASISAFITALLSGDVLAIYRYNKNRVHTEFIDGQYIINPNDPDELKLIEERGNTVCHGVETDSTGKQVAFHVLTENKDSDISAYSAYKTKRIEAFGEKSGRVLAKLVFGNNNYRIDSVRGMPLFSAILENASQITRYRASALAKAEEIANTALFTEHKDYSTGEDPRESEILAEGAVLGINVAQETAGYDGYAIPTEQAKRIAMTTKRKVYNMPIGATMKTIETSGQLEFPDFYKVNFGAVCASVSIPPEVGLLTFNSNYTAAQLAASFFRNRINFLVKFWGDQAYTPFLELMLEVYYTSNKLKLPCYDECRKDWLLQAALMNKSWSSDPIPKADPLKEAKTSRVLLGDSSANIPLTSPEREALANNIGDWNSNIETYKRDFDYLTKLGVSVKEEEEEMDNENN